MRKTSGICEGVRERSVKVAEKSGKIREKR